MLLEFISQLLPSKISKVFSSSCLGLLGSIAPKGYSSSRISFTPPLLNPSDGIPKDNGSKILLPNDSCLFEVLNNTEDID